MSIKLIDDTKLTAIGAAIRTKGGTAALIDVDDMPEAIADLPSGGFDLSVCTGISFYGGALSGTPDLSTLDTSGFTSMNSMFSGCSALTSLDLSDFDTPNVTAMNSMLRNMTALQSVNLSNIDTTRLNANALNYFVQGDTLLTDIIWSQKTTVQPLVSTPSTAGITSSMKFYVPDNLVSAYKSATNWSAIASQIYPISQLPASVAALYGIE